MMTPPRLPSTTDHTDYDSSPECFGGGHVVGGIAAMKSPGMNIPTPSLGWRTARGGSRRTTTSGTSSEQDQQQQQEQHTANWTSSNITTSLVFPHPLQSSDTAGSSPLKPIIIHDDETRQPHDGEEEDDEDAFLPDDFAALHTGATLDTMDGDDDDDANNNNNNHKYDNADETAAPVFTLEELQAEIEKSRDALRQELQEQHEEELEASLAMHLREHGQQWKQDAEVEYARLGKLATLAEDRAKATQAQLDALKAEQSTLQEQLTHTQEESKRNEAAKDLYLRQLHQQIQDLQTKLEQQTSSLEDLVTVQSEKTILERQLVEAKEANEQATARHQTRLENLHHQIESLQDLQVQQEAQGKQALDQAQKNLAHVEQTWQDKVSTLEQAHQEEIKQWQAQVDELKTAKEAEEALKEEMDRLRVEYHDEKVEIVRSHSVQADELQTQLSMKQQEYDEVMEDLQKKVQDLQLQVACLEEKEQTQTKSAQSLKAQLASAQTTEKELQDKVKTLEHQIESLRTSHEQELQTVALQAKQELDKELGELEKLLEQGKTNDSAAAQVTELKAQIQADKEDYARQIRTVREGHTQEIDDLLKQLDLIEAEHEEKMKQRLQTIKEKEAVISALGQQLTEAESQLERTKQGKDSLSQRIEILEEEVAFAKDETQTKAKEIQRLMAEKAQIAKDEAIAREQACAQAREEMIQRAEIQFEELNSTYKKLKHKFDEATSTIATLEADLVTATKRITQVEQEKATAEADLSDQLASAKAAVATADLNAARKVKQYRQELSKAQESKATLETRLEEALATSRSVQTTLASLVAEKERLLRENQDLKAVSEELLELVEGKQPTSS